MGGDVATAYRTCPLCEATCGPAIDVAGGEVVKVRGDKRDVFPHGFLCPKGVAIQDVHDDTRRVRAALVKQADGSNALADEQLVEPLSGTAVLNGIPVEVAPVRERALA